MELATPVTQRTIKLALGDAVPRIRCHGMGWPSLIDRNLGKVSAVLGASLADHDLACPGRLAA